MMKNDEIPTDHGAEGPIRKGKIENKNNVPLL
jgi:hypothetical protein